MIHSICYYITQFIFINMWTTQLYASLSRRRTHWSVIRDMNIHSCSNGKTCLHDVLVILKRILQNYLEIMKKCFIVTVSRVLITRNWLYGFVLSKSTVPIGFLSSESHFNNLHTIIIIFIPCYSIRNVIIQNICSTNTGNFMIYLR